MLPSWLRLISPIGLNFGFRWFVPNTWSPSLFGRFIVSRVILSFGKVSCGLPQFFVLVLSDWEGWCHLSLEWPVDSLPLPSCSFPPVGVEATCGWCYCGLSLVPNSMIWNARLVRDCFEAEDATWILLSCIPSVNTDDRLIWAAHPKGSFSVRSGSPLLGSVPSSALSDFSSTIWKKLWSSLLQDRLKLLLWKIAWNALPVKWILIGLQGPVRMIFTVLFVYFRLSPWCACFLNARLVAFSGLNSLAFLICMNCRPVGLESGFLLFGTLLLLWTSLWVMASGSSSLLLYLWILFGLLETRFFIV